MHFYKGQHKYYCGIDLHARKMYVRILDQAGRTKVHKNIDTDPGIFFELIFPFLDDVAVAVECVFCWHWLADMCAQHNIPFVLGRALNIKAINGCPRWNITLTLVPNNTTRMPCAGCAPCPVSDILALAVLNEVVDIGRFKIVQDFCYYARLIRPEKESDGKWAGRSNKKIGNAHLKYAINEAAMLFLRRSKFAVSYREKLERKHGKGKSHGIFTHKVGRAVNYMLKNKRAFNKKRFFDAWILGWKISACRPTETIRAG